MCHGPLAGRMAGPSDPSALTVTITVTDLRPRVAALPLKLAA